MRWASSKPPRSSSRPAERLRGSHRRCSCAISRRCTTLPASDPRPWSFRYRWICSAICPFGGTKQRDDGRCRRHAHRVMPPDGSMSCSERRQALSFLREPVWSKAPDPDTLRPNHARRGGTNMSKLEHIRPSGLHHNPAYSHVVVAAGARTIYIAGQVSTDEEGRVVGEGDLAAQTTQVMHNIGLALKAAGASYANIVKITTFVVGYKPELRPIIGKARSAFFEGMEPPASTLVGVTALAAPEWLIEIEAVAVVD